MTHSDAPVFRHDGHRWLLGPTDEAEAWAVRSGRWGIVVALSFDRTCFEAAADHSRQDDNSNAILASGATAALALDVLSARLSDCGIGAKELLGEAP